MWWRSLPASVPQRVMMAGAAEGATMIVAWSEPGGVSAPHPRASSWSRS